MDTTISDRRNRRLRREDERKQRRHKAVAAVAATGGALTLMTAVAVAQPMAGHHGTGISSNNDGAASISQYSGVNSHSNSSADTGDNSTETVVAGVNLSGQKADGSVTGGNASENQGTTNNTAQGGQATNGATNGNTGGATGSVTSGAATSGNTFGGTVGQDNSGGVSSSLDASKSTVNNKGFGGAKISSNNSAQLDVSQSSCISSWQTSSANTGGNSTTTAVIGVNGSRQNADSSVTGGSAHDNEGTTTNSATGGTASNTASNTNTGTASSTITTGAASSTNSGTVTVTQTNSGGVTSTSNTSGQTVNNKGISII